MSTFTYHVAPRPLNTVIEPEEYAYPSGSLRQSRRFGRALCSDGKVRRVKLGVADTFFSVPAICKIKGKTVHGIISGLPTDLVLAKDAPKDVNEIIAFYPHGKHRNILPSWDAFTVLPIAAGGDK